MKSGENARPPRGLHIRSSTRQENPTVQYPDRPSRGNPFANRDHSLIGGYFHRLLDCNANIFFRLQFESVGLERCLLDIDVPVGGGGGG
jgi:hypothetical protein